MGEGPNPVVIADSGPLIHLHEIDRLPLLGDVFSAVCVPQAVWDESVTRGTVPEQELEVVAQVQRHQIAPEALTRITALPDTARLHQGELECLALCRETGTGLLLTDDLAARKVAKSIGVRPVGSLGVIARAFHQHRLALPEAEDAIEKLYSVSTLFVSRAIVELAIAQLRRPPP